MVSIDTVDDFEKTVNAFRYYNCNNETGVNPAFYIKEMSLSLDVAYDLYRKDWCKTRGFRLSNVQKAFDKGEEYDGQMFVCKNEFADCEYQDKEYVKYLFSLLFKN